MACLSRSNRYNGCHLPPSHRLGIEIPLDMYRSANRRKHSWLELECGKVHNMVGVMSATGKNVCQPIGEKS